MIAVLFPVASNQSYRDSIDWVSSITFAKQSDYIIQLFIQYLNKRDFTIELQIKDNLEQIYRQRWLRICNF